MFSTPEERRQAVKDLAEARASDPLMVDMWAKGRKQRYNPALIAKLKAMHGPKRP